MGKPKEYSLSAAPAEVAAGKTTFVVANRGSILHEMVVVPSPGGAASLREPDGTANEAGTAGEVPDVEPGAGGKPRSRCRRASTSCSATCRATSPAACTRTSSCSRAGRAYGPGATSSAGWATPTLGADLAQARRRSGWRSPGWPRPRPARRWRRSPRPSGAAAAPPSRAAARCRGRPRRSSARRRPARRSSRPRPAAGRAARCPGRAGGGRRRGRRRCRGRASRGGGSSSMRSRVRAATALGALAPTPGRRPAARRRSSRGRCSRRR